MPIETPATPWYTNIVNYLAWGIIPAELSYQKKKKFLSDIKYYQWEDPLLYKHYADQIIRRCANEMGTILHHCHDREVGGHIGPMKMTAKVLQCGFCWPILFKDAHAFMKSCNACQRSKNISKKNEIPLNNILEVELSDVWEIGFVGPFPLSYFNQYILVALDYVSKWMKVVAVPTIDAKVVVRFLKKNKFSRIRTPRAIISDGGMHFCNHQFDFLLSKYGVKYCVAAPYHLQTSG